MGETKKPTLKALETVERATLEVHTSVLERNGIERLRILSESRFLELLKDLEARRKDEATDRMVASSSGENPSGEAGREAEGLSPEKRSQLRARHDESLKKIEGRMERLSRAFLGIQSVVEKLQGPAAAAPAQASEPAHSVGPAQAAGSEEVPGPRGSELHPAVGLKQLALLRQMLLTGEEP